jgi:hypothetical protein
MLDHVALQAEHPDDRTRSHEQPPPSDRLVCPVRAGTAAAARADVIPVQTPAKLPEFPY